MLRLLMALALVLPSAHAEEKRPVFAVPDSTLSPDRRYGVTVPSTNPGQKGQEGANELIEVATGKSIAVIKAEVASDRMNHERILPSRWSKDGKFLLWEVDGKWFPFALVLLKLENDKVTQHNLLELAQKAILAETKKAAPAKYETAKKANAGNGTAYPDGFSIDVEAIDPITLPLHLSIALTSNPKGIETSPTLESSMDAVLTEQGQLEIRQFKLGPGVSRHF